MTASVSAGTDNARHDPTLLNGGGAAWCNCSCGWASGDYRATAGAHLAFGEHLAAVAAGLADEEGRA